MLHHIELNVSDLQAAWDFYSKLLPELGYEKYQDWPKGFSFKQSQTYIVFVQTEENFLAAPYHRKATGLNHLAFHAESRAKVDELTEKMRQWKMRILYEDRHPFAGGTNTYAVFCEDPDRMKIEIAVSDNAKAKD